MLFNLTKNELLMIDAGLDYAVYEDYCDKNDEDLVNLRKKLGISTSEDVARLREEAKEEYQRMQEEKASGKISD